MVSFLMLQVNELTEEMLLKLGVKFTASLNMGSQFLNILYVHVVK